MYKYRRVIISVIALLLVVSLLAGFVVMALAMLLVTVIAMVREGDGFKSYVPMAPGLMAWTATGCAVAAGLGAAM